MKCKLLQISFDGLLNVKTSVSSEIFDIHKDRVVPNGSGFFYFPVKMEEAKAVNKLVDHMIGQYVSDAFILQQKIMKLQGKVNISD